MTREQMLWYSPQRRKRFSLKSRFMMNGGGVSQSVLQTVAVLSVCKLLRCCSSSQLTFTFDLFPFAPSLGNVYHMSLSKQPPPCGNSYLCILNWTCLLMSKAGLKKGWLLVVCFRILIWVFSPVLKATESQIPLCIPHNFKHRTSNSISAQ